jgi:hypothetical protein
MFHITPKCGERGNGRATHIYARDGGRREGKTSEKSSSAGLPGNLWYSVEFSTQPHDPKARNVSFVMEGVYSRRARPYNPDIAGDGGAEKRQRRKQAAENERDFDNQAVQIFE